MNNSRDFHQSFLPLLLPQKIRVIPKLPSGSSPIPTPPSQIPSISPAPRLGLYSCFSFPGKREAHATSGLFGSAPHSQTFFEEPRKRFPHPNGELDSIPGKQELKRSGQGVFPKENNSSHARSCFPGANSLRPGCSRNNRCAHLPPAQSHRHDVPRKPRDPRVLHPVGARAGNVFPSPPIWAAIPRERWEVTRR